VLSPPASRTSTETFLSSESLLARTQPAAPAPTITLSRLRVSDVRVSCYTPHTVVVADESSLSCGPCHRRPSGRLWRRILERVEKRVAMATAHGDENRMKTRRKSKIARPRFPCVASFLRVAHIYSFLLKSAVARSLVIHPQPPHKTSLCNSNGRWNVQPNPPR
jgi:hypothetical protein